MKWWEISLFMLCTGFCYFTYIVCFKNIFGKGTYNLKIRSILIIMLVVIATYYNTFYNYGFSKILISYFFIVLVLKSTFSDSKKQIFIKSSVLYMSSWMIEAVLGSLIFYLFFNSVQQFDSNIILKILFSFLMMLILLLSSYIRCIKKMLSKVSIYVERVFKLYILIILFIIVLVLLTFYLIVSSDLISYISILSLLLLFITLFVILIYQSIKTKRADEKQEILLNFMKEYEVIIDKERIDRHEMVNNLLVLKSIKDKNSKQYNKILDDMLLTYKSSQGIKGIYDLPSGLKGVLYYKIYDIKNKNINIAINISNKIISDLENLPVKTLIKVCKILGILLDNAREAAEKSKVKEILIDMYKEGTDAIIYIENTMPQADINMLKIKEKGFSTKGKNRGYGLFLVEKLTSESKKIEVEQKVDNKRFISVVKIKK